MDEDTKERLHRIANLSIAEIGTGENNVKYKLIIPLLECFGYKDPDLEHPAGRNRIDILVRRGKSSCSMVIETKKHNTPLDNYLSQLKGYCDEKRPSLGIITNGEEIRIYSPFWRVPNFSDTLLYTIKRRELCDESIVKKLERILSKDNQENGTDKQHISERENEIEKAKEKTEKLGEGYKKKEEALLSEKKELEEKLDKIEEEINEKTRKVGELEKEKIGEIQKVWEEVGLTKPTVQSVYLREKDRYIFPEIYKDGIEIILKQSFIDYKYLPIHTDYRALFPDYNTEFVLETNAGKITKKLRDSRSREDHAAGDEIGISEWYSANPELKPGDKIFITTIEPKKRYNLIIAKDEILVKVSKEADRNQIRDKIKNVTRNDILIAMQDLECKKTGVGEVVEYEGVNYPIRHLIRLAAGLKHEKGIDHTILTTNIAKSILRKHGFTNFKRVK